MNPSEQLLELPENNFISSYAVADSIVAEAVESHSDYWKLISDCQDHIDGKKPHDPDKLKKKGMSWASNFNFGKARAKIEKGTAESIASINDAFALGYPMFRGDTKEDERDKLLSFLKDKNLRGVVASAIGMSLFQTLSKESRLSSWLNQIEYPSFTFGYAALLYNQFDWIPEPIHPLNIAFKPRTKPDKIETWVTFDCLDARSLYNKWIKARREAKETVGEDEMKVASSGWVVDGLEAVLLNAFQGKLNNGQVPDSWEQVIPMYVENPSSIIMQTESVSLAKIHYAELDGSLTIVYIPWQNQWQVVKRPGSADEKVNLNEKRENKIIFTRNYKDFDFKKWVGLIRDSGFTSANGYIQELRGIAKFAVEDSIRYNRLRNGINNKMQFVGSPFFEQGAGQIEKFKISVSQGFIIVPPGHSLIERQPSFDISSHINVLRFEEGEYMRDTQQFDASIQGRLTSRPNKGEVQAVSGEVEFLEQAKNSIKFRDYAQCFFTILQRLPELTIDKQDIGKEGYDRFYEYCIHNLKDVIDVESKDDVNKIIECIESYSLETFTSNVDSITVALQLAETPFGRNRLKRMLMVAKGFPIEEVNIAIPLIADKYSDLGDARVAAIENDMMFTTSEIIISGGDDHITHLDSHSAKCERVIEGVKTRALSPVDAFKFLQICIYHMAEHNDLLMAVPSFKQKAEEYQSKISAINKAANEIKAVAEQMMQEQQRANSEIQMDPEKQARIAIANEEAAAKMQRTAVLQEARTAQREKQIDIDHQLREKELELKYGQK